VNSVLTTKKKEGKLCFNEVMTVSCNGDMHGSLNSLGENKKPYREIKDEKHKKNKAGRADGTYRGLLDAF
jgi:hypothetical protein